MGPVSVGFDELGQLLIIYFGFVIYCGRGDIMRQCIEYKEAYDSDRW
jgi:hypothetical protein